MRRDHLWLLTGLTLGLGAGFALPRVPEGSETGWHLMIAAGAVIVSQWVMRHGWPRRK